jgi:hypothetical protein
MGEVTNRKSWISAQEQMERPGGVSWGEGGIAGVASTYKLVLGQLFSTSQVSLAVLHSSNVLFH